MIAWLQTAEWLPQTAHDWFTLLIVDVAILLGMLYSAWRWLLGPLHAKIAAQAKALETETEERKLADNNRDKARRELAEKTHNALGRIDMLEHDKARLENSMARLSVSGRRLSRRFEAAENTRAREQGELRRELQEIKTELIIAINEAVKEARQEARRQ